MTQSQYPSSFDHEALLASGRGELFGPGNAQLPAPPMLMFDRITTINADGGEHGKGYVEAELDIHPDLWFFQCHFVGDPVMPGCLGLDAMWQLVGFYLGWKGNPGRGRALGAGEIKFTGQVLPSASRIVYHITLKRNDAGWVTGATISRQDPGDKVATWTHEIKPSSRIRIEADGVTFSLLYSPATPP